MYIYTHTIIPSFLSVNQWNGKQPTHSTFSSEGPISLALARSMNTIISDPYKRAKQNFWLHILLICCENVLGKLIRASNIMWAIIRRKVASGGSSASVKLLLHIIVVFLPELFQCRLLLYLCAFFFASRFSNGRCRWLGLQTRKRRVVTLQQSKR